MVTIKQALMLSAIADKLNIKIDNPEGSKEQVGAELMMQIVKNAHKAETEILNFIVHFKKITTEEAENIDIIKFLEEITKIPDLTDFFKQAVK